MPTEQQIMKMNETVPLDWRGTLMPIIGRRLVMLVKGMSVTWEEGNEGVNEAYNANSTQK